LEQQRKIHKFYPNTLLSATYARKVGMYLNLGLLSEVHYYYIKEEEPRLKRNYTAELKIFTTTVFIAANVQRKFSIIQIIEN
jgi:hypothetical protein